MMIQINIPSTSAQIAKVRLLYDKLRGEGKFNTKTAIIDCHYYHGLNVNECANVLGITIHDVENGIAGFTYDQIIFNDRM